MANIVINELSSNYTYNVAGASYATVALPISAQWGPGLSQVALQNANSEDDYLDGISWERYPANRSGLEAFVSAYRGPMSNYKLLGDYSYQIAMSLLTAGYDVLTCRITSGYSAARNVPVPIKATGTYQSNYLSIQAKYPGTFGNNLLISLKWAQSYGVADYLNLVVYVVDASGVRTSAENLVFRIEESEDDSIPMWSEVESKFIDILDYIPYYPAVPAVPASGDDPAIPAQPGIDDVITDGGVVPGSGDSGDPATTPYGSPLYRQLMDGTDSRRLANDETATTILARAVTAATARYGSSATTYTTFLSAQTTLSKEQAARVEQNEWKYTYCLKLYDMLTDKLSYNPNRIISPGWDDQNYDQFGASSNWQAGAGVSPLHKKLMDVAYNSRCATALIDIPVSMPRSKVYNESTSTPGYAQMLSRSLPTDGQLNNSLYSTHSALFAPWGQFTYMGINRQAPASPSFLALMIQRAMVLNQALQYEWALPTSRNHNLRIGKLAYTVPKKVLDEWQSLEGVGVNVITNIPDLGTGLWGNSTLYEVPPATYQALANLSTRYLVNAIENVVYRCGISITYRYNNEEAYAAFYAGVTPILDTMKNVGAIDDYYVQMAADINGLDQVNANSVVGKIYLIVNGVINDITVDLIALPPGTDLTQYMS